MMGTDVLMEQVASIFRATTYQTAECDNLEGHKTGLQIYMASVTGNIHRHKNAFAVNLQF
jgi:hypothetical protein